jgi:hypothetical protein
MFSCKVLIGPIATDKEYHAGDTVCLDKKDADTLSGFGLVEIIGEVEPRFVAQVVPTTDVVETAPKINLFPVADVEPVTEVVSVAGVVETAPVGVGVSLPLGTIVAPEPVVETPAVTVGDSLSLGTVAPVVETPVDEAVVIDGEEAIGLAEVAGSTGSKRKK